MSVVPPLPERLRPNEPSLFLGQGHLATRLTALLAADHLPSILFFGPPGCGKSTMALLLARHSKKRFVRISAPETGLQTLRKNIAGMDILILDEIHRFSKTQQDFFLPLLESGELTLLATTTENPSFSVKLRPLERSDLAKLAQRGAQALNIQLTDEAIQLLCDAAAGDARTLLNLVESVSSTQKPLTVELIREILPEIIMRHDKKGDSHYEYASALIKSIRGSDPDAALYYLACLLEGGEDPRFICRRLILSASEDVGLADPRALQMAVSCQQAVEFVGMPEGFLPLAETTVYLAIARKSNSAYAAYLRAQHLVKRDGAKPVPLHLRNAVTNLQKEWGFGKGYKYPHNFPDAWVPQEYFPEEVKERSFYQPGKLGEEPRLSQFWQSLKNTYEHGRRKM